MTRAVGSLDFSEDHQVTSEHEKENEAVAKKDKIEDLKPINTAGRFRYGDTRSMKLFDLTTELFFHTDI